MGTDSGGWPHMLNMFHGPTALREMELMAEAGMTPADVLRSATVTPARMMGIESLVGTVEVGKCADLIVVRGNPLEDISALGNLEWVIKDGEARRPPSGWRTSRSASAEVAVTWTPGAVEQEGRQKNSLLEPFNLLISFRCFW